MKLRALETPEAGRLLEPFVELGPKTKRGKNRARPIWKARPEHGEKPPPSVASSGKVLADGRINTLRRIVRRVPEVLVKVTGSNVDAGGARAHMNYLRRKDGVQLEDEMGRSVEPTAQAMNDLVEEWDLDALSDEWDEEAAKASGRKRPANVLHIVLSMPAKTEPETVIDAAREWAGEELENHRHLLVLHTDRDHPHVHVVVNNLGYDMRRLQRGKDDLARWRRTFARALRARGVEAEATPRKARGVVQKSEKRALRKARTAGGQARPLRVLQSLVRDAIEGPGDGPWLDKIRSNRRALKAILGAAWQELRLNGQEDEALAHAVGNFQETLPAAATRRQTIHDRLRRQAHERADAERNRATGAAHDLDPTR